MNKKWKKTTLTVAGVALVANPITANLFTIDSIANDIYFTTDDAQYNKQIEEAKVLLKEAKESKTEEDITIAIDTIVSVQYHASLAQSKYDLLNELTDFINDLRNSNKTKFALYLTGATVDRLTKSLLYDDYLIAHNLVTTLPEGKVKEQYLKTLETTKAKMAKEYLDRIKDILDNGGFAGTGGGTPPIDWSKMPDDVFDDYENEDTGNYLPGYPIELEKPTKPNPTLPEYNFSTSTVYQTVGSKCYKVTTKTIEGKRPTVTKELVTGHEASFCSVLVINGDGKHDRGDGGGSRGDYNFSKVRPSASQSGSNIGGGRGDTNSYFGNNNSSVDKDDVKNEDLLTLQFTLDKTEAEPYFIETDMLVGADGTITYQQQRDVLFQLAIKGGGKAVEDKDRFLVLLENKIIVIDKKSDKIPVTVFDTILKDFKAQVKAMERKVGQ